jgi:hypothetical protein
MLPISLMTWANLNFTLCKAATDPFVPLIGDWYYLFSEFYLNVMSVMIVAILITLSSSLKL